MISPLVEARKLNAENLEILKKAKASNVLLMSDSSCATCSKLIKKLPKLCKLKPKSFLLLATGNIKKNKKKLSFFETDFEILYSKERKLLSTLGASATPSLLINKKHYVTGYFDILKYFNKNKDHFCTKEIKQTNKIKEKKETGS